MPSPSGASPFYCDALYIQGAQRLYVLNAHVHDNACDGMPRFVVVAVSWRRPAVAVRVPRHGIAGGILSSATGSSARS
jgi:hypothetical protein